MKRGNIISQQVSKEDADLNRSEQVGSRSDRKIQEVIDPAEKKKRPEKAGEGERRREEVEKNELKKSEERKIDYCSGLQHR